MFRFSCRIDRSVNLSSLLVLGLGRVVVVAAVVTASRVHSGLLRLLWRRHGYEEKDTILEFKRWPTCTEPVEVVGGTVVICSM